MGYSPTEYAEFTEPPAEMSSRRFLLRRVWHLAIPTPPAMGYSPTEYAEFTEPPAEMSSHGFLLRRVWHLAIPTPPAMGYSPTEYAEFTEPPAEMSSHGFLLRRVWHLAIPTPPAMGYSPTEYAEFTEPPTEMFSHRIHRIHRIWQRGYGRDAIPSYICAHLCHLWEALLCQKFLCVPCVLWEYLFSHGFHRCLGCALFPRNSQNSQNSQNLAAWVWQGCQTLLHLCSSVPSVGVLSLQEVLCIRCIPWKLLHRLFGWCSRDCCTPWRNPQK